MKNLTLLFVSMLVLWMAACKKDDNTNPPNNNPSHPYYFKFMINGTSYNFNEDLPQYMPFYPEEVGGYQEANLSLFPSIGLRLSWNDTARESDIMGLIGKTLYFSDTAAVHPELSFDMDFTSDTWYSVDTANANYNVKITNIAFLKNDTSFNPLRTYVITGTCSAVMTDGTTISTLTGGEFHYIVSRMDL